MSREVVQEEVYHLLCYLLNNKIQISLVRHPCLNTLRFLHIITLVDNHTANNSTTCTLTLSFDFKKTLILENAIIRLEVSFFTYFLWVILIDIPISTGRFTDAKLSNHFLYSVTLDNQGLIISHLCTRAELGFSRN